MALTSRLYLFSLLPAPDLPMTRGPMTQFFCFMLRKSYNCLPPAPEVRLLNYGQIEVAQRHALSGRPNTAEIP
jgi:hypothetical protein